MKALTERFDMAISGGDLARTPLLNVCVTAWGALPEELPRGLRRGVAQQGDVIFLVGRVGLARLGLSVLEETGKEEEVVVTKKLWPDACAQHLRPMPLAFEGMKLGLFAIEHGLQDRLGLMDVSDGLARDLPRLLDSHRSGLGADIRLIEEMLHPEVTLFCGQRNLDASQFAFEGGEDYALLGTCPAEAWPSLEKLFSGFSVAAAGLGTVKRGPITLNGTTPNSTGFDHFSA